MTHDEFLAWADAQFDAMTAWFDAVTDETLTDADVDAARRVWMEARGKDASA